MGKLVSLRVLWLCLAYNTNCNKGLTSTLEIGLELDAVHADALGCFELRVGTTLPLSSLREGARIS